MYNGFSFTRDLPRPRDHLTLWVGVIESKLALCKVWWL